MQNVFTKRKLAQGFHEFVIGVLLFLAWSSCNLKFPDDHEAEQSVQAVQTKRAEGVLDLRKQPVVGHFLSALHVVPGVQLVNVTRQPVM